MSKDAQQKLPKKLGLYEYAYETELAKRWA